MRINKNEIPVKVDAAGATARQPPNFGDASGYGGNPIDLVNLRNGTLAGDAAQITLVSATDGNHGRSLARGCGRFGARCRTCIHAQVSGTERIRGDYDESVIRCRQDAEANGWFVISDTSWPGYEDTPRDAMAGYGVIIHEVHEQADGDFSHVFLQGGVGARTIDAGGSRSRPAPSMCTATPKYSAC